VPFKKDITVFVLGSFSLPYTVGLYRLRLDSSEFLFCVLSWPVNKAVVETRLRPDAAVELVELQIIFSRSLWSSG